MLTAKGEETDIVTGLNLGADDYMTKPFSVKELLARAEALLRRKGQVEPDVYEFADCRVDTKKEKLTKAGAEIMLSPKEYKLLKLFLKKRDQVLTRDEILKKAFGYSHFISEKNIDDFVASVKDKIESSGKESMIQMIDEIGYKFELAQE